MSISLPRSPSALLILSLLAGLGFALPLSPPPAHACSCQPPLPVADALARSPAVFEAVARGPATPVSDIVDPSTKLPVARQLFEVKRRWKGEVALTTEVFNVARDSACGNDYSTGRTYLVYVDRVQDGRYWDSSCSRTKLVEMAGPDLAELGEGMAPLPDPPGSVTPEPSDGGCRLAPARRPVSAPLLALAPLALALLLRRRRIPR